MTCIRYHIDPLYPRLVVRKIRPVWEWERDLKWTGKETGLETCAAVFVQDIMGLGEAVGTEFSL